MIIKTLLVLSMMFVSTVLSASECPNGPYIYYANINGVYDGDTVTADIDLGFHTWRHDEKLRLFGINAPEVRGKDKVNGIVSRDWLREKVLGKRVLIHTVKHKGRARGKYGRYLARLFIRDGEGCFSINEELVNLGLAKYHEY